MDEGAQVIKENCPWEIVEITEEDFVYRQIPVQKRIVNRNRKYPSESCFILRDFEDSLSFNLERYINVDKNYKLIGITYSNGSWLNYTSFKIIKFPVIFLRSLSKFSNINHSPVNNGQPSDVGHPNNKSHTSLYCEAFDEGVRVELSDYCLESNNECEFDVKLIREEIEALRGRGNETPFHNLWDFDN